MAVPRLSGSRVTLSVAEEADRPRLLSILGEPSVARWWGSRSADEAVDDLFGPYQTTFVIEVDGDVVGSIQIAEEEEPDYRHAGIDLFLDAGHQGLGLGPEAIELVARYLFEARGHHRLTIDPAAANVGAIRACERVGFRRVGIMRAYERGRDGSWHDGLLMDLLVGELRVPKAAGEPGASEPVGELRVPTPAGEPGASERAGALGAPRQAGEPRVPRPAGEAGPPDPPD